MKLRTQTLVTNMKNYHRIIVAIDVYAEYDPILQCALSIADKSKDVFLVFVTLPCSFFEPYISKAENTFVNHIHLQAKKRLLEIAFKFGIPKQKSGSVEEIDLLNARG